jgi:hypothetical protein
MQLDPKYNNKNHLLDVTLGAVICCTAGMTWVKGNNYIIHSDETHSAFIKFVYFIEMFRMRLTTFGRAENAAGAVCYFAKSW